MALQLPDRRQVDAPLLVGSVLFGVGPGTVRPPSGAGIVGLWAGSLPAAVFFIAMLFGIEAHAWTSSRARQAEVGEVVADS